jgi:hypothetical protein
MTTSGYSLEVFDYLAVVFDYLAMKVRLTPRGSYMKSTLSGYVPKIEPRRLWQHHYTVAPRQHLPRHSSPGGTRIVLAVTLASHEIHRLFTLEHISDLQKSTVQRIIS